MTFDPLCGCNKACAQITISHDRRRTLHFDEEWTHRSTAGAPYVQLQ